MYPKIKFSELIPGNLGRVKEPGGIFWHLTWKEKTKTVSRYIRLNEVDSVQKGVRAYRDAKAAIKKAANANLKRLFQRRKSK